MEDYEGPVNIRLKPSFRKKSAKKVDLQFEHTPCPRTDPMGGYSVYNNTVESLFDIPRQTSLVTEDLEQIEAKYQPIVDITTTLKLSKLNLKTKGYTIDEIKAVLYLKGMQIPPGTKTKDQYVALAKASGVVSKS